MNIHQALADVAEIRAQLDRSTRYGGFRSLATGFSGLFCVVGAWIQSAVEVQPGQEVGWFLTVWLCVAFASSLLASIEMILRGLITRQRKVWLTHRRLVGGLMPSLIVGSVLTFVLANSSSETMAWALPGSWAMIYGLGLFSCRQDLPKLATAVANYFMVGGLLITFLNFSTQTFAAWQMVVLFGVGQLMLGTVLYRAEELSDVR